MKPLIRYTLLLLFINILIAVAGYLFVTKTDFDLLFNDIILLAGLFSVITLITLIIFLRGQSKEPDNQTMHSLVSVGLKFLLEMLLALVWFIVAKKTSFPSVLIFFILYLTFTLFSIGIILKTLKKKSL